MNYAPLWIKTDYSILSSMIKIDDLINKLISLDIKQVAVCDDNLFYAKEFYDKCSINDIKPIIGLELNFDYTILLYAKNYLGYQNLCTIDSLKNANLLTEENVINYLDNIIAVLPFEYKNKKDYYEKYIEDIFIGYKNDIEKNSIEDKKVFINKTLVLNNSDKEYLKYLYMIKGEEFNEDNVSLLEQVSIEDKKTTLYLANLVDIKIEKNISLLPVYSQEKDFDAGKYLANLCIFGLKKRLNNNVSEKYINRLKYELDVIDKMGFNNYFLIVWDYVKYAKKNNIMVGPGRGSAASSLVSYSLGITDIDPLKYNLLFERFLNPSRVTMPDIDIDFDASKRELVIDYVTNKYGKDKVSGIITFSNLTAKQVIRDVSKIFEISTYKIDNLLKNFDDKKNLKENYENINVKKIINSDNEIKRVYDVASHLEGLKRHTSSHAAGIIISKEKLNRYVPLQLDDNNYLCGYTMNYIEDLGLLKMDFLGLKNLTIIDNILKQIDDLKFNDIPLNDRKTFELFCSGNLDGIFQFESSGMRKFITELKPDSLDDLIAAVALFRPGPFENIPTYIHRKHKEQKVEYIHDDLKPILESTYGIIIYQEQIMQIASKMAGFSFSEADNLRRAMSKKKEDILLKEKDKFIKGSKENGYSEDVANKIYELILKFANYGFNKAHSVCYAIIGYKMAYLKVHYPLIFMKEYLNDCMGVKSKTKNAVEECKILGVEVVKPSINNASYEHKITNNKIEYSLALIKDIGTIISKKIIQERSENGLYKNYTDFVRRNYKLGKNIIRNLALSGALDEFNITKKTMIENLDEVINYSELCEDLDYNLISEPELKESEEYSTEELTKYENELYGFYMSNHPVNKYINNNSITINKLGEYFDKFVNVVLYFERKKDIDTKTGDKMMFINASDLTGSIELVMFPTVYKKYFNVVIPGIYNARVKVEKRFSKLQLVIFELEKLDLI